MDKLRVCLANDSFPPLIDGVATAVVNYAENINRRLGYATVVTPDYPGADDSQYDFPVIRYLSIDFTKFVGYRAGVPFSAELLQRLQAEDFQIIHSHCPITSTILARILRKRADIPIVCTYHTKFDIDIAKAIRGKILQEEAVRLLVKNISACDEVWTVSEGAGKTCKRLALPENMLSCQTVWISLWAAARRRKSAKLPKDSISLQTSLCSSLSAG